MAETALRADPVLPRPSSRRAWMRSHLAAVWARRNRNRLAHVLRAEELAGLTFAFKARGIAAAAIALWLVAIVPMPRLLYFLGVVGAFFLLGLVPHLLRRHRHALAIKLTFAALDVALITAVIILPTPFEEGPGWPIQMRLRWHEYLYLLLYLAGSALSYSPLNVLWTGGCVCAIWSFGFLSIYFRDDTLRFAEVTGGRAAVDPVTSARIVLDPHFVGLNMLTNQLALTLIMTGLLAAAVWRARQTLVRQAQAEVARADLARYVSPDVADAMAARPDREFGRPATRQVAVLFADIVGFTAMSEALPPERTVALLKSFHARACKIVFRHGGTLDKFLGDGFMATFGTLLNDREAARRALECAFDLQAEIERWTAKRAARGAPGVMVAVGVHYGPVVVGNVGAERRMEFTVVGDSVNVASRLERFTREDGCRIALSREVAEAAGGLTALPYAVEARGAVQLRGRQTPIEVFVWPGDASAKRADHPLRAEEKADHHAP